MTPGLLLQDAEALLAVVAQGGEASALTSTFVAWARGGPAPQSLCDELVPPLRSYDLVAAAAIAEAAGWLVEAGVLDDGLQWLVRVTLERMGMPAPVVTDGVAHFALALAARTRSWLADWLETVWAVTPVEVSPPWLSGGGQVVLRKSARCSPEVRILLAAQGVTGAIDDGDSFSVLQRLIRGELPKDPVHAQVVLAAVAWIRRSTPVLLPGQATAETIAALLSGITRGLQQWPWEEKPKTKNSRLARWHIDNEYHVQALLWAVLAPIFPDLRREEYAAQLGPIQPRVDFGIPSLRLLIEAKFARNRAALKDMVNEIAQDVTNYFAVPGSYDRLLVFIWDDGSHTQDHHVVSAGIRAFERVVDVVIVSRPGHMAGDSA